MDALPLIAEFVRSSTGSTRPDDLRSTLDKDLGATLSQLQGEFSLCVKLTDGRVVLAVDRFARHSLCWTVRRGYLEVGARADDLAGDDCPLNVQALFDYVFFHTIPSPCTIFDGISRIPAAHYALVDGLDVEIRPYWYPNFSEPAAQPSFIELKNEFLLLLKNATSTALANGSPACYLSGGTDSSTVLGMVRAVSGEAPRAYSIGFDAEGYDEMVYARLAAARFGAEHHAYYVTPADLLAGISKVAGHYDQPFGNSSALPAYYCALRAQEDGVTRLLAGDGGDELFGGNERYAKQRVFGYYDALPGWLRTITSPLLSNGVTDRVPLLRKVSSYVRQATVPLPDRLQTYNLLNRLGATEIFSAELLSQVDVIGPREQQRQVWTWADQAEQLNRNLAFDWRYTLAENDLPKVVGTALLAGIQVGFPLLDDALLAFSMKLPVSYKLRDGQLRWFFKEALRGFLPDEIITKPKHGFGLPFGVWMRQHEGLQAMAADSLRSLATRGIVNPNFIGKLLEELTATHAGYYGEMVWVLMMLEQWLRQHRPNYRLLS